MQKNTEQDINQFKNKTYVYSVNSNNKYFDDIDTIEMSILNGLINGNQNTVRYRYYNQNKIFLSEEMTGLIFNSNSFWLHPPRDISLKKLEFTPFPYIRFDSKKWEQEISVGKDWLNNGEDNLKMKNSYKLDSKKHLKTPFGKIKCYKVVASGTSSKTGTSKLTFLFNKMYGIIELNYILPDKSILTLKLNKIIEN